MRCACRTGWLCKASPRFLRGFAAHALRLPNWLAVQSQPPFHQGFRSACAAPAELAGCTKPASVSSGVSQRMRCAFRTGWLCKASPRFIRAFGKHCVPPAEPVGPAVQTVGDRNGWPSPSQPPLRLQSRHPCDHDHSPPKVPPSGSSRTDPPHHGERTKKAGTTRVPEPGLQEETGTPPTTFRLLAVSRRACAITQKR
jgi:hypothetical protein